MTPWSAQEDTALKAMHGMPLKEIARQLGRRSPFAVGTRLRAQGLFTRMRRQAEEWPRVTVSKSLVCEMYALGWRFAKFDGSLCVMEWRNKREPRFVE